MKDYELEIKPVTDDVFWTTFGNNTRIELKNSSFAIGKLGIGLQKFDDHNKQIAYISCYLDLDKALSLCNDILVGRLVKEAGTGEELKPVRQYPGGQSAERANREDHKPLYREFSIMKGKLWIVKGQEGPGKTTETGGFAPDGKAEKMVSVGMSDDAIRTMAIMINNEYQAYRTAQHLCQLFKNK